MDTVKKEIFIIGQKCLQNDLLVCHVDEKTGLKCQCVDSLKKIPFDLHGDADFHRLILVDCLGVKLSAFLERIPSLTMDSPQQNRLAILNLCHDLEIEKTVLENGIRGIFYEEDSVTVLLKGIKAIFAGDVWISRKTMVECFMGEAAMARQVVRQTSILTSREEEILRLLARGNTNESIADSLCISPHTVRTHIYNIFKKIKVPNRLQASLWAAKNL